MTDSRLSDGRFTVAVVALVAAVTAQAANISTNVSTVAELADAITYLNGQNNNRNELVLAPGKYAVDDLALEYYHATYKYWTNSNAHLGLTKFTMRGKTGNPDDVIIYLENPDASKESRSILYSYTATIRDLTISNYNCSTRSACCNVNANSIYSNVVVTCCQSANGGGANSGRWTDCTFRDCSASSCGGAVYSKAQLFGCTIEDCYSFTDGGGAKGASLTDCTIRRCISNNGGGVCGGALTNCWVEQCSADTGTPGNGGGVYNAIIYGGVITNNFAGTGGGVYGCTAANTIEGCTIVGNRASASGGGVAKCETLKDCLIANNTAVAYGGGVIGDDNSSLATYVLTDCTVSNNTVSSTVKLGGGGVAYATVNGGRVTMNQTIIDDPAKSVYAYGGGTYVCKATGVTIDGNAVTGVCKNVQGGGDYGSTLVNCTIMNNISETMGGALVNSTATWCVISNNASLSKSYTGIRTSNLDGCTVYECTFDAQDKPIVNSTICNYTNGNFIAKGANAITQDEGLSITGHDNLIIGYGCFTNCLFIGQRMTAKYGGLFYASSKAEYTTILSSCTIADNQSAYTFAGFTATAGKLEAVNCVFSDNLAYEADTGKTYASDLRSSYLGRLEFSNCLFNKCVSPKTLDLLAAECPNCITNQAALFCRAAANPYCLRASSPAVGAGVYQDWMEGATDIRRDAQYPRSVGGLVDMGCYQGAIANAGFLIIVR